MMGLKIEKEHKRLIIGTVAILIIIAIIYIQIQKPYEQEYVTTESGDIYDVEDYILPSDIPEEIPPEAVFDFDTSLTMEDCQPMEDELKDRCILEIAEADADYEECGLIEDQDLKDLCLYEIAYNTNDATPCSYVIYGVSDCYYDLAIKTNNPSLCEYGDFEKRLCFDAVGQKDLSMCERTGNKRTYCNPAVIDNNVDWCYRVPEVKGACYRNLAVELLQHSLCDKALDLKEECYYKLALETNNANLCNLTGDLKDFCFAWVAFNTNNPQLCEQAGAERESCLADLAE